MTLHNRFHPWLCYLALATLLAVLVQIGVGSVVTGIQAGMSDPDWPTPPWQVFFPTREGVAYRVEQTHRGTGSLVGVCVIALAVGLWVGEPRPWLRWPGLVALALMVGTLGAGFALAVPKDGVPPPAWLGPVLWFGCLGTCLACVLGFLVPALRLREWAYWRRWLGMTALAGVIAQGLLGGFRVFWNTRYGPELAIVHGCLAQAFLVLVTVLATFTSRGWSEEGGLTGWAAGSVAGRWTSLLAGLVSTQVVLGVFLSHTLSPVAARLHFLAAMAVVVVATVVVQMVVGRSEGREPRRLAWFLAVLVGVQLFLGVEAWMVKFLNVQLPEAVSPSPGQVAVRAAHVLGGSLVLATSAVLLLQTRLRAPALTAAPVPVPVGQLEGVA
jgi:heme a synthase